MVQEVRKRAGDPDFPALSETSDKAKKVFADCKERLQVVFDALLSGSQDRPLEELRTELMGLEACIPFPKLVHDAMPKGMFASRDTRALQEGVQAPPHLQMNFNAIALESPRSSLEEVARIARQARRYLEMRMNLKGKTVARADGTIFIGHGHSSAWRDLKDFIKDRLELVPDEFNLESAAGLTTAQRLEEMLDSASFAFLVMTAEDEHADNTLHARENVIHEVGLFQGRLGFRRAIVMLEEGCKEFSNIQGLGQIRFPRGNIKAKSEEIRQVLEREGLLKK
ncbi:nucleotide-binding protein [Pyxidicoccus parkwayensis]|uniref:Nucleotide-binding protein n=1 Tax=Pyxidicoccus parkwayensis TaxID=2813578 RepID=A0ABX7NP29_9BACT|nr:nucleotide-binding protein [Pyxidicoccus parkwaysis]QSQ19315.1 nucleotide-binding protein [Pyxidicoccus parkwaysis]